jgi:NTP pyrophosphatase (non-canonical NTP hydrolase)
MKNNFCVPNSLHKSIMRKEKLKDLIQKVEAWAEERNLLKFENAPKQYLKFLEETGELARAILKNDVPEIVDSNGDVLVTVIILAKQLGIELETKLYEGEVDGVINLYDFVNLVSPNYVAIEFIEVADAVVKSHGYDLVDCLEVAYNVISKRKGKTLNGIFTKA